MPSEEVKPIMDVGGADVDNSSYTIPLVILDDEINDDVIGNLEVMRRSQEVVRGALCERLYIKSGISGDGGKALAYKIQNGRLGAEVDRDILLRHHGNKEAGKRPTRNEGI